jgi:hypothetical protein
MATAKGADKWTTKSAQNGVGNPALNQGDYGNPSMQDKDTNTTSNLPVMKATSHMEGMKKDGGNPDGKWNAVQNKSC